MPFVEPGSLFLIVLSNLCRNLAISHFIDCFNTDDASAQPFARQAFFELPLCLARTEDQNGFCALDVGNHVVVVLVEVCRILPVALILRRAVVRRVTGLTDVFLHARFHALCHFCAAFAGTHKYNDGLFVVNPQTCLLFHQFFSHLLFIFIIVSTASPQRASLSVRCRTHGNGAPNGRLVQPDHGERCVRCCKHDYERFTADTCSLQDATPVVATVLDLAQTSPDA